MVTVYTVEVRGRFQGGRGDWRPAMFGVLNPEGRAPIDASTFADEAAADAAAARVVEAGARAEDVRITPRVVWTYSEWWAELFDSRTPEIVIADYQLADRNETDAWLRERSELTWQALNEGVILPLPPEWIGFHLHALEELAPGGATVG